MRPEDILDFWFSDGMESKWYFAGPEFDQELITRFGEAHRQAVAGELSNWSTTRPGRLPLILLLDQFSRNIHRDQPAAYAQDAMAFEIAQMALRMGDDLYYNANHSAAGDDSFTLSLCTKKTWKLSDEVLSCIKHTGQRAT